MTTEYRDTNGDGVSDVILIDTTGDGIADREEYDTDGDGHYDSYIG